MKRNLISKIAPGGGILFCLKKFVARRFVPLVMVVLSFSTYGHSQGFCGFDNEWDNISNTDINQMQIYQQNEVIIQNFISGNPLAISSQQTYTIPVVFHVMHLNEIEGTGSNIDASIINDGLAILNQKYAPHNLQFCLARRDPDGNATNGINRIDCSGVSNYSNLGLDPGVNELNIKDLSRWPNSDYINVWVVHNIYNPDPTTQILGLGTFPGTYYFNDGIVLRSSALSIGTTFTHEVGHYFNLYHTFQGSTAANCPSNNDCLQEGDKVCDTQHHKRILGTCLPNSINECTGMSFGNTVENYMSYFDCRVRFSDQQGTRMRMALMALRSSLMTSQGCENPCPFTVSFDPKLSFYTQNLVYNFKGSYFPTNLTGLTYNWTLNGITIGSNKDLGSYSFSNSGLLTLCYEITSNGCTSRKCVNFSVSSIQCTPTEDCNLIENGDFQDFSCSFLCGPDFNGNAFQSDKGNNVCFWGEKVESPDLFIGIGKNAVGFASSEIPLHMIPLGLVQGTKYKICYEYLTGSTGAQFIVKAGLAFNNDEQSNSGNKVINSLTVNPDIVITDILGWRSEMSTLFKSGVEMHEHSFEYTHTGNQQYFYLDLAGKTNVALITNIVVSAVPSNCCNQIINGNCSLGFSHNQNGCGTTFSATSTSSYNSTVFWNFGDGTIGTGNNPNHNYLYPGTFKVCATINCDFDSPLTICDNVTISPSDCITACTQSQPILTTTAIRCGVGPYLTTFSIDVPKGTKSCSAFGASLTSLGMSTSSTGYSIVNVNATSNRITINAQITPNPGFNLDASGVDFNFTLCDTLGNPVCYIINISSSTCTTCENLNVNLLCTDQNPFDNTNTYSGILTIPNLPNGAILSNAVTSQSGLTLGILINNSMPLSFSTTQNGSISSDLILMFYVENQSFCYRIKVSNTPCPSPPVQCIQYWNTPPKPTGPCVEDRGMYKFNFSMTGIPLSHDLQICSFPVVNIVTGNGEVLVNSLTFNSGRIFDMNIDIFMPCDFDQTLNYEVKLYVCDLNGNVVCLSFLFDFPACINPCLGGGGTGPRTKVNIEPKIYPNPTTDIFTIESNASIENQIFANLYDQLGRKMKTQMLNQTLETLDVSTYGAGIYILNLQDSDGNILATKKLIVLNK